jgi:hypothetical protein
MTVPVDVDKVTTQEVISAGHEGHFLLAQKVVFPLSRSLAKLSVYAAKAQGTAATPQILSVDLLAAGTREFSYLFPQTDDVLKAVVARANNRTLLEQIVPVTKAVAKGTPAAEDPASYTPVVNGVYLPEVAEGIPYSQSFQWNVSSGDSREAVLNVRYTLDEGQDIRNGYIYLPRILRNNHIKICILINAEGQIIINYTVADWNWDESMMQDWFFFYPTHSYLWHAIPQTEEDLHIRPGKATMSENQPFVGYFQMTDPVSGKKITKDKVAFMVNIDQIGSTLAPLNKDREDYMIMLGNPNIKRAYNDMLKVCNESYGLDMDLGFTYYGSENFTKLFYRLSDQRVFADNRIPAVMFTSGITMNNNKTRDTAATLNMEVLQKRVYLIYHWIEKML